MSHILLLFGLGTQEVVLLVVAVFLLFGGKKIPELMRGIEVEYLVKQNEGHGFSNEENRLEFYSAMEQFLGVHLAG